MTDETKSIARVIIPLRYAAAMAPFISTEETRYYLNGICVQPRPTGTVLLATDGHVLGMIHDPDAWAEGHERIWRLGAVAKAATDFLKASFSPQQRSALTPQLVLTQVDDRLKSAKAELLPNGTLQDVFDGAELQPLAAFNLVIDGTFPDVGRLFPNLDFGAPTPSAFNPALVARIGKGADAFRDHKNIPIAMVPTTDNNGRGPFFWSVPPTADSPAHMCGLLMPMRADEKAFTAPGWLREYAGQPAAKAEVEAQAA